MNRSSVSRTAAILAALAIPGLALPATVMAQPAPQAAAAPANGMAQNVEAHIKTLHDQLQITPAEEPEWASFAQVMRGNAAQMEQAFSGRGAKLPTMNAVEDLDSYAQIAQIQSTNMQKLATAFQSLYSTFPAPQQKVADGVFRAKMASHSKPGMKAAGP